MAIINCVALVPFPLDSVLCSVIYYCIWSVLHELATKVDKYTTDRQIYDFFQWWLYIFHD